MSNRFLPSLSSRISQLIALIIAACFSLATTSQANTDVRNWTVKGQQIKAELVDYEPGSGQVILRLKNEEENGFQFKDFSTIDKAWLVEWIEFEERLLAELEKVGGAFKHITTTGKYPTDLFVYYPSSADQTEELLPALVLFHPGGKGARYMLRHVEAAEAASLILIACGQFRNTHEEKDEAKFRQRWLAVFPQILQRVAFDTNRLFLGGTSGGASRAFDFTTYQEFKEFPYAGIYSNAGWLGGKQNYDEPFGENMRVVMVNGNNDHANAWIELDSRVLEQLGCEIAVVAFEGAHQVPPPDIQLKAFNWLLEQEQFQEE